MKNLIIVSGPVIIKDNKVLVDKHRDDFWKFCGGVVSEEETIEATAINRAKKELGIDVNIINKTPYLMHVKKPGQEEIDVILIHWLADYSGKIIPGEEIKEWTWLDINNLPEDIAPNIIPVLKHFKFL